MGCGPRIFGGEPIVDIDAQQSAACRPEHDVVVKRAVCDALVATDKAAAVHKQQYGARCVARRLRGRKNIKALQRVAAEGLVAGNGGGVWLARLQRGIKRRGCGRVDDCAELA